MNQPFFVECCALTDVGRIRSQNEDSVAIRSEIGVAVLADGMGGYQAGEVASQLATETTISTLVSELARIDPVTTKSDSLLTDLFVQAIQEANREIFDTATRQPELKGMGTTLVATLFHGEKLLVAHVGDSRAYRLRAGMLDQITKDHSEVQMQVDVGLLTPQEARHAPNKNLITRALGIQESVAVEIHGFPVRPDDLYLLCSDGLTDMLEDRTILEIVDAPELSLSHIAQTLIELANQAGGLDNISVVVIRVMQDKTESGGFFRSMGNWIRQFD